MKNPAGSYGFESLETSAQEQEIWRLKNQANTIVPPQSAFLQQLGIKPGMKVLDLACGSGVNSCQIAKFVTPGKVIGVDLSKSILAKAELIKARQGINNVEFYQGDAYQLDFPEASFDFVYVRLLFQHLTHPLEVLKNIHRVLKPGGLLCVLDIDEGWATLYPEPESFTLYRQSFAKMQKKLGGDTFVGRKLGSYLQKTALVEVKTHVEIISSDDIGLDNFLNLLSFGTPYNSQQKYLAEVATQAKEDAYALLLIPYAWAGLGIFVVTGRKV